jgi:hypothetical protein
MSLDGLRAWIGEVERKLGVRTRVFWVLVAIAIGGAGAGIYLALKAADDSVSKSEVQALHEEVESAAGTAVAPEEPAAVATLKAEVEALRSQLEELQSTEEGKSGGTTSKGAGKEGKTGGAGSKAETEAPGGGGGKSEKGAATGGASASPLKELVEKAKEEAK